MSIPTFAQRQKQWSSPPVDDIGYIPAADLLAMDDQQFLKVINQAVTNRYGGWRNHQENWTNLLTRWDTTRGKRILDYGCGIGLEGLCLARKNTVFMAGFDPTPAEEVPRDDSSVSSERQARVEGPQPLSPPTSWAKLTELTSVWDEATHDLFVAFSQAAARSLFGPTVDTKKLSAADKKFLLQKCAGAAVNLRDAFEPSELPYPSLEDVRAAFASVLDGVELAIPEEELDAEAAEAAARES